MTSSVGDREAGEASKPDSQLVVAALHADEGQKSLEAARRLRGRSRDETIQALLTALDDENAGVRWLAGEALIQTGAPVVAPLLHRLVLVPGNAWLYEEAEHVLRHLQLVQFGGALMPVLEALQHSTRSVEVPVTAELALQQMKGSGVSQSRS